MGDTNGDGRGDMLVGGQYQNAAYLYLAPFPDAASPEDADAILLGENDPYNAGKHVAGAGDVNGDGFSDMLVGNSIGTGNQGAAYLVTGPVEGEHELSGAYTIFSDTSPCQSALWLANAAGDMNGDGCDDVAVSMWCGLVEGYTTAAYIYHGPLGGIFDLADADVVIEDESAGDRAGSMVRAAGDVDGDGNDDLLIGATSEASGVEWAGAVYLVKGPMSEQEFLSDADAKIIGHTGTNGFGWSATPLGDIDFDEYDDVLMGAYYALHEEEKRGGAYLFFGPLEGVINVEEADVILKGEHEKDYAGLAVAGGVDLLGDGYPDILVGAPGFDTDEHDAVGIVYLVGGASVLEPTGCQCRVSNATAVAPGRGTASLTVFMIALLGARRGWRHHRASPEVRNLVPTGNRRRGVW